MNTSRKHAPRFMALSLAAFLLLFFVAACDSGTSATEDEALEPAELTELAATLKTELDLSADQAAALNDLVAVDETPQPGRLWTIAAALQERLSDEQKAKLLEKAEARFADQGRGRHFQRGEQGRRGEQGKGRRFREGAERRQGGRAHDGLASVLTPEQQAQMKALRTANREQMQALSQARRDGSLTTEAFQEQAQALRNKMHEDVQALLTDEQKAELAQRREARKTRFEEMKETAADARAEALGLTTEQEAALEALAEAHQAERKALMDEVRTSNLDREAAKARFQEMRDAHKAEAAAILTPEQAAIMEIHHALRGEVGFRRAGRKGGRHGKGGPRGFGGGPHRPGGPGK